MMQFLPNNSLERTGDSATNARDNKYAVSRRVHKSAIPGRSARSR